MTTQTNKANISTVIQVNQVKKDYGNATILEDITFEVQKGDIFGLIGSNGAGKTTAIRILLHYIKPTSGTVFVLDHPWREIPKIKHNIGYLPDSLYLYPNLTGIEFLTYLTRFYSPKKIDWSFIQDLIQLLEFKQDITKRIKKFSQGMRQKLSIISTFMAQPDLIFLDEPTTALDPVITAKFHTFLKNYQKKGKTIFLSTHLLSDVEKVCNKVAIIKSGKIIKVDKISNLTQMGLRNITVEFSSGPQDPQHFPLIESMQNINYDESNKILNFTINVAQLPDFFESLKMFKIVDCIIEDPPLDQIFLNYYNSEL